MATSKLVYLRNSSLQNQIRRQILHPFPVAAASSSSSSSSLIQPTSTIPAALQEAALSVTGFPLGMRRIDPIHHISNARNSQSPIGSSLVQIEARRSYARKSSKEDSDLDPDEDFDDETGSDDFETLSGDSDDDDDDDVCDDEYETPRTRSGKK